MGHAIGTVNQLALHIIIGYKVADFTGYLQREAVGGVAPKGFYARLAFACCVPEGFFSDAIGCYCTESCNNYASLRLIYHNCLPLGHLSCLLNYLRAITYRASLALQEQAHYSHPQNRWNVIRPH